MFRSINPWDGSLVAERRLDTPEAIDARLAAAARAFEGWRALSLAERGAHLRAIAAAMRDAVERLANTLTAEVGKPIRESRGEVEKCAWSAEHFAEHAEAYLATEDIASDATSSRVQHLPLGTVLGILPWNSPLWLAFRVFAPAIMAGNTCLLKPDPHVPGTAEALDDVLRASGLPDGVVQPLYTDPAGIAAAIEDRRVHAVSFTGSTRAGRRVAVLAAGALKPAVLELGGSDPAIVLADADLDQAAADVALMRIIASGQSCIAAKRVIVEAPVHDAFVERLRARLAALVVGDPRDPATDMGPIARRELQEELHRQVTETVEQGARCVLGGELPDGVACVYPPTLLVDVRPGMTAFTEETFGPIAAVSRAANADEAVALANDTDYGLGASVFTADRARGEAMASRIQAGQVAVNGLVKSDPRLPSGGIKRSGYGRELGPHGIREFVNAQQVWVGPRRS